MLLREEFSSEEEMEKWLRVQAVGFVEREFIAIFGINLLTEEVASKMKGIFQMTQGQPLDAVSRQVLNQLESSIPQLEDELAVKGQIQRLEDLKTRMHEFERQHGLRPPQESTW